MKNLKSILTVILLLISIGLKAQDFPYQYFIHTNPMLNNPSLTAVDYKMEAGVSSYNLWAGGFRPLTDYLVNFSVSPDFRNGRRRNAYQTRIGLGGVLMHEKIGPFNQDIFQLIYAYHIPLTKETMLSLGICGLVEYLEIDLNSLSPLQDDDPRLLNGNNSSVISDGGFGASVQSDDFRISFSILNLTPAGFRFKNGPAADIENYRKFF